MRQLNEEEANIANRFLFLSMAIVVLHQDSAYIRKSPLKIKENYIELIGKMITMATNERRLLRKKMQAMHMQVVTLDQNGSFTSYLFTCQGKEEKCNYFNPAIRSKVKDLLGELMQKAQRPYQTSAANV
ncbi:hypothetical protein ACFSMW_01900 [Virgibacillus halophilus]|uniref:Uncharacterized protein n=1 Tax=Tigheibacillus halophilus TaxID=361280 RepID=A0ABU5CB04_9BACI|nr:hypothetical protein [Virgibacillus halophilus]